jgi:integrative and conjugative element protein (TIGR02256 family)
LSVAKLNSSLSFRVSDDRTLDIQSNVVNQLNTFCQTNASSKEAGGILLGRIQLNSNNYTIQEITTPMPLDRRSRHTFYRSKDHHNIAVERWRESGGKCLYLGLWHTHPEAVPTPSGTDYRDWKKALMQGSYEGNTLLFIIIGTKKINCWKGVITDRDAPKFKQLIPMI